MENWLSLHWFSLETIKKYEWVHPFFLYAIPTVFILFAIKNSLSRKHKQKLVYAFYPKEKDWLTYLRFTQPICVGLAVTLILVALARPQLISERTDQYSEGIDIMLLLDISDSMLEKDLTPNRLQAAKIVAKQFIKGRLQDRIGLIVFAGEAVSLCPLTNDYELLYGFLNDIQPSMIPTAGTAIGSALAVAVNRLRETQGNSRVAILLSDGDNTTGNLAPETSAQLATAFGIKVYTIAIGKMDVGGRSDTLNTINNFSNENELKKVAELGGGISFRATDTNSLSNVFKQIDKIEKVKSKDVVSRTIQDFYRVYLYWAVLLLLIALATKSTFMSNILED